MLSELNFWKMIGNSITSLNSIKKITNENVYFL